MKLQKKWKGIRDTYVKDRNKKSKSGSGASTSKDYVYSHLLSFLNPMTQTRPSKTPPPVPSDENITSNIEETKVTKKAKRSCNDDEDKLIQTLMKRMDDRLQNRDSDRLQNRDRSVGGDSEQLFIVSCRRLKSDTL